VIDGCETIKVRVGAIQVARLNVEDLLDQHTLQKVVAGVCVEKIERKYELRP
jgi:hypothetical protein